MEANELTPRPASSLSWIVAVYTTVLPRVALVGASIVTMTVSSGSSTASSLTVIETFVAIDRVLEGPVHQTNGKPADSDSPD